MGVVMFMGKGERVLKCETESQLTHYNNTFNYDHSSAVPPPSFLSFYYTPDNYFIKMHPTAACEGAAFP